MARDKKTDLRLTADEAQLKQLRDRLYLNTNAELVRTALTLLDVVSEETVQGRVLLTSNKEGEDIHKIVMRELQWAEWCTMNGIKA